MGEFKEGTRHPTKARKPGNDTLPGSELFKERRRRPEPTGIPEWMKRRLNRRHSDDQELLKRIGCIRESLDKQTIKHNQNDKTTFPNYQRDAEKIEDNTALIGQSEKNFNEEGNVKNEFSPCEHRAGLNIDNEEFPHQHNEDIIVVTDSLEVGKNSTDTLENANISLSIKESSAPFGIESIISGMTQVQAAELTLIRNMW